MHNPVIQQTGLIQLTGRDLRLNQTTFEQRTPADPIAYVDDRTGEVYVYGTQVDGSGLTSLRFENLNALITGGHYDYVQTDVYLPNNQKLAGKEAIWDAYRLAYRYLKRVFPNLDEIYIEKDIRAGSDLYYGGIALNNDGTLGNFPNENWRRRIHVMAERPDGRLQVLPNPVFNPIPLSAKTSDYPGFARLPSLPGNYLGHAYGANFKIVQTSLDSHLDSSAELWLIHEEVSHRVRVRGRLVEITEVFARRMIDPFAAQPERVTLLSARTEKGRLVPDACRGPEFHYTKLLEGFRPTSVEPEGIRIKSKADASAAERELFFLTGSAGNFCGDDYDVLMAVREGSAIGPYKMLSQSPSRRWKRFVHELKIRRNLSWAGRGSFLHDGKENWWLLFHGVDKELKPGGSYSGKIPPNTEEYHRNIYLAPVEFVINSYGEPDVLILD